MSYQLVCSSALKSCKIVAIVLGVLLAASVSPAQAADFDWTNTSNVFPHWIIPGNWTPSGPPGASDTARFDQNANYEVWWTDSGSTNDFEVLNLNVLAGDVLFLNLSTTTPLELKFNKTSGTDGLSISGAGTTLTNRGMNLHSLGGAEILDAATLTLDGSHPQGALLDIDGAFGHGRIFGVSG